MTWRILQGGCMDRMKELDAGSIQTVVTSPPYWGLRDYGTASWEGGDAACDHLGSPSQNSSSTLTGHGEDGVSPYLMNVRRPFKDACGKCGAVRIDSQLGLESTPEEYVSKMVEVFREVRRVLRDDGTVWLNMGDSYASDQKGTGGGWAADPTNYANHAQRYGARKYEHGLKPKDLVGIPWRLAFALQADGWYLRSDIIWAKPNSMPESVTDRPTKAHEYVFLLTKQARYFYDADAVREPNQLADTGWVTSRSRDGELHGDGQHAQDGNGTARVGRIDSGRNLRSVWNIPTEPFPEAHFATFPKALVEPCIKAGTSEKGCCPECGAAWVRQTEHIPGQAKETPKTVAAHHARGGVGIPVGTVGKAGSSRIDAQVRTLGWTPACSHTADPIPCTVLDPFAGSGTTGVVALRLGRSFIGIELSLAYAEMARKSLETDRSRDGTLSMLNQEEVPIQTGT